jgi:exodeoxyribonuclease VII large subunit
MDILFQDTDYYSTQQQDLSVSQLLDFTSAILDEYVGSVTFHGEIHEVKVAGSGHLYFTLKDANEGAQAAVSCVMWRSAAARLGFRPTVGLAVSCVGRPTVYRARGQFQIDVRSMSQAGDGALRKRFEELRAKLEKEGLFDPSRKRAIPGMSRCIGVVTSAAGAVLHDIAATVRRRMPSLRIVCADVRVQGKGAAEEIVRGIELLNTVDEVEIVVVARGGGSLEDLWAFNEELVVRAIFASRKPVISGVGHEVDVTLADFAADLRAPTPTAAAEIVAADRRELLGGLEMVAARLLRSDRWLRDRERFVDQAEDSVEGALDEKMRRVRSDISTAALLNQSIRPDRRIVHAREHLERTKSDLGRAIDSVINQQNQRIKQLERVLLAINPQRVLDRGFALVLRNGHVIESVEKLPHEGSVAVRFRDGERSVLVS